MSHRDSEEPASVADQGIECRFLSVPGVELPRAAYNGSLILFEGRRLMAYRQSTRDPLRTSRVWMLEFGPVGWEPVTNRPVRIGGNIIGAEDPRLFHFRGELWMAWTESYSRNQVRMAYGRIGETDGGWTVLEKHIPGYGHQHTSGKEKNWQFFEHAGRLFCQYSLEPYIVLELDGATVVAEFRQPMRKWPHGDDVARGGTPPIPFDEGRLITFFHAHQYQSGMWRRSHFAALVFDAAPPFTPRLRSTSRLVTGSALDPIGHRHPTYCVFPCGAIGEAGRFHVSAGVNDYRIAVFSLDRSDLMLQPFMRPSEE